MWNIKYDICNLKYQISDLLTLPECMNFEIKGEVSIELTQSRRDAKSADLEFPIADQI